MATTPTDSGAETRGIAITGSGIVTSAGRGADRTMDALVGGGSDPAPPLTIRSGLANGHPVFEVGDDAFAGFETRLPGGRGRRSLRLAIVAASDAVAQARRAGLDAVAPARIGVLVGATVGGMNHGEQWLERCCTPPRDAAEPRAAPMRSAIRHLPLWEIPVALAARFGFGGPAFAVSTACTSGMQAIVTGGDLIATGVCDAVLAGGVDCLARITYHGFSSLGVMSRNRCTPFDAGRSGLNLGEGAAFVVLVRAGLLADAARFPRLAGWSSNTDAHHMTAPRPDGSGVAAAIHGALSAGGVGAGDVGWVHAHGTATPTNDAVESAAVRAVFGRHRVPVSSTKHLFGHTLGAAGSIASVVSLHALRNGFVPGNARIASRDAACDVDVVPPSGFTAPLRHVVVGSLGFGGSSCALVLSGAAG